MPISPVDRFAAPSSYLTIDAVRRDVTPPDLGVVDSSASDPRRIDPVDRRPVVERSGLDNLTSSARAATVALAAAPRDAAPTDGALLDAVDDAEDAALAALADPLDPPTPREVAENFAAIAALVPTPQQLADARIEDDDDALGEVDSLASATPAANDKGAFDPRDASSAFVGARLSRFA